MKKIVFLFAVLVLSLPSSIAWAQDVKEARAEDVARAETYLQDLKTAQARFVQTTHDGTQLVGTFYLSRPGRLRFEYDPPIENFVVADGSFIYFYDAELEEQTNAPIQTTLANFFLREKFELNDDLVVKNAKQTSDMVMVTVVQAEEPEAGSITFAFSKKPFELKKWRVVDGQGLITEVELFYLNTGVRHDKSLFYFVDPKKGYSKPSYND